MNQLLENLRKVIESEAGDTIQDLLKIQASDPSIKTDEYMHGLGNGLALAKAIVDDEEPVWVDLSEKEKYFVERTTNHIKLVQKAIQTLINANPEIRDFDANALEEAGKFHDKYKFQSPEKEPYIELTWRKKEGIKEITPEIQAATLHHVLNNQHHPEYWAPEGVQINLQDGDRDNTKEVVDATAMPPLAIAEMVCDWVAMSEELKTNTAREWYLSKKDVRWHFSPEQEALIDKFLKVFEKDNFDEAEHAHLNALEEAGEFKMKQLLESLVKLVEEREQTIQDKNGNIYTVVDNIGSIKEEEHHCIVDICPVCKDIIRTCRCRTPKTKARLIKCTKCGGLAETITKRN